MLAAWSRQWRSSSSCSRRRAGSVSGPVELAETWPDGGPSPSFRVDGQAWIAAATACDPRWTAGTEQAWRQAWLLLSEVLAEDALSPFSVHT